MTTLEKLTALAALVQVQQIERQTNRNEATTKVIEGKKYAKVNIGSSGRYMVEMTTGNIFGIKGYGQVHKGHFYGTLDTTHEWTWGDYYPERKGEPLARQKYGIPALTFAPENKG